MVYTTIQLEDYVRQRAPVIARDIQKAAEKAHNEADLVAAVGPILERFAQNFDIQLNPQHERTLLNGRADAVYNRFVIEYEPPRSLRKSNTYQTNKHAIGQVQQYLGSLERLDRHRKERMAGVAVDGSFFIFVRFRDDRWFIDDPLPVNAHSTETFLRYLLSLSTELALTPENLVRDFGENSNTARQVVPVLYSSLLKGISQTESEAQYRKVRVLFQQWQHQFREVSGYDPNSGQLEPKELARLYNIRSSELDLEKIFFAIHTYYATFIKLLALQVAQYYLMPKVGTGLSAAADYDSAKLCKWLQDLERGGLFAQLGIRNFLEGDFFGWYLDIWDEPLEIALKRLIGDLANYSLVTLDVDPEETRDLLKQLYQNLMPKKLRHALGEYYTPDWLAERLLNQLGYDGNPAKRILDPACGSGTFPVLAIKRARKYIEDKMLPPAKALEQVLNNIVGFDLNPLAVISARTNYLLALGDLLEARKGDISIPIYLADSILTPSEGTDLFTHNSYSFNTAVGRFTIPRSLVQARYIDILANLLEECVHVQLQTDQFRIRVLQNFPLQEPQDSAEITIVDNLYTQLLKLEQQGINGIWARIIKNAFAPLFQGKFDYIMGNPPWVNWESLPQDYRQEIIPLWTKHNLFSHKGFDAILGKSKDDISVLMTYIAIDKYLIENGKLGFIITQSVFKTTGGGQGFRRFQLGNGIYLRVFAVDDMARLKPFEGASNRTSIFILVKGQKTIYPVPYNLWYRPDGGATISESLSLSEITNHKIATYHSMLARPIDKDDYASPWITGKEKALQSISNVLGVSDYRARAGVCTWLNGVYWIDIINKLSDGNVLINNLTETSRREIENVQVTLEPDLVYPLLRGRDVSRWQGSPQAYIVLTHKKGMGLDAIPETQMAAQFPKTYSYLNYFEEKLRGRSGYSRYFKGTAPFYSIFNIGDYTFAPYKVVWREQASGLVVAVIEPFESQTVIPDHKLMLVDFEDRNEAHYLCGALNSSPARFIIISYGITIQMDTHILENVGVPRYNPQNSTHVKLSMLSQQAHAAASINNMDKVQEIENEIDQQAAKLWGLTEEELKEIQESLEELG